MNRKIMYGYYIARDGINYLFVYADQFKSGIEYSIKTDLENCTPETICAIGKYKLGDTGFRDINNVKILKKFSNRIVK